MLDRGDGGVGAGNFAFCNARSLRFTLCGTGSVRSPGCLQSLRLASGQRSDGGQLNLASRGVRLGAAIIDQIIFMIVLIVPMMPGIMIIAQAESSGTLETAFPTSSLIWFLACGLCLLALLIWNAVWLGRYGQTIGKRMLGIRVVTFPDGQPAGYAKAFWLRAVVNFVIVNVVPLYGIVDACFIFREDKRCVHDLIAETTVVTDKPGY